MGMGNRKPSNGAYTQAERIASVLMQRISSGEFAAGDRLGSEQMLANEFGASRGTIRRALAILQDSDLVQTKPGSGSYVAFHGTELTGSSGWTAITRELGMPTRTELLSAEEVPTPGHLIEYCSEPTVYRFARLRLLEGEALSLEVSFIPANEQMVTIMEFGLLGGSISKTLSATGMKVTNGYQDVNVGYLDAESAALMGRDESEQMIRSVRTGLGVNGCLVEYVESWLDPTHFSFHLTFGEPQ